MSPIGGGCATDEVPSECGSLPPLWSISPLFRPVNGRNPRFRNFRKYGNLRIILNASYYVGLVEGLAAGPTVEMIDPTASRLIDKGKEFRAYHQDIIK